MNWLLVFVVVLTIGGGVCANELQSIVETNCTLLIDPNDGSGLAYASVSAALSGLATYPLDGCPTVALGGARLAVVRLLVAAVGPLTGAGNVGLTVNTSGLLLQLVGGSSVERSGFDAQLASRVFTVTGGGALQLANLKLSSGSGQRGGCLLVDEQPLLLHVDNCLLTGCRAALDGGALAFDAAAALSLVGAELVANLALAGDGGAVALAGGAVLLANGTQFRSNAAALGSGGAVWLAAAAAPSIVDSCLFDSNVAVAGGALAVEFDRLSSVRVSACSFVANTAASDSDDSAVTPAAAAARGSGGALLARSLVAPIAAVVVLDNSTFAQNEASVNASWSVASGGGAVALLGYVELRATMARFADNAAAGGCSAWGGAVLAQDGGAVVTLWSSTFEGNQAAGLGSALAVRDNPLNPYFALRGVNAYDSAFAGLPRSGGGGGGDDGCAPASDGQLSALLYQDGSAASPFFDAYACPGGDSSACPYNTRALLGDACYCFYGVPPEPNKPGRVIYWSTGQFVAAGVGSAVAALVFITVPAVVAFVWKRRRDRDAAAKITGSDVLNVQRNTVVPLSPAESAVALAASDAQAISPIGSPSMVSLAIAKTPQNVGQYIVLPESSSDSDFDVSSV